jgi:hypothetical protein
VPWHELLTSQLLTKDNNCLIRFAKTPTGREVPAKQRFFVRRIRKGYLGTPVGELRSFALGVAHKRPLAVSRSGGNGTTRTRGASQFSRKIPRGRGDEERLTADIIELAQRYGRYGYRKVAGLLRQAGWIVNDKRVERIWRHEGLKVPDQQPKRGRLWLADGSCVRLRPQHRNQVWSYDFVEAAPTMDADIGCSMSLTNLPTNAWRCVSPASLRRSM